MRLKEYGRIEILVPAIVVWGLHNEICWMDKVAPGFVFNSMDMVGSWHNIISVRKTKKTLYRVIGPSVPATDNDKINRLIPVKRLHKAEWVYDS